MASRLRRDPATVYDVLCEVGAPAADGSQPAFVLWKYPDDFADAQVLKAATEFAFPLGADTQGAGRSDDGECSAVQLFSFVLTDGSGRHTFGHCRHTPKTNTTLCLCTALPWPNVFYKILNHVADVMNSVEKESEFTALLERTYLHGVPAPGETLHIDSALGRHKLEIVVPDDSRLPTMQENRNLMEYWNAVGETHMCTVFASMLRERRIIFTGPKLGQLSSCVLAAALLIRPMYWQHIFVPVLPTHLSGYLSAPMPYIIGVPSSTLAAVQRRDGVDLSDTVVVHVHDRLVHSPFDDYESMPSQRAILRRQLDRCNAVLGDGLARAFLRAIVALVGDYRSGLIRREDDTDIHFDTDKFIYSQKPFLRPFLEEMRHLQIFQEFVNERVAALNAGEPIDDEFENEARVFDLKDFTKDLIHLFTTHCTTQMRERGREALSGLSVAVGRVVKDPGGAISALAGGQQQQHHPTVGRNLSAAGGLHRFVAGGKSPRSTKNTPPSSSSSSSHRRPVAAVGAHSDKVKRRPQSSFYYGPPPADASSSMPEPGCSPADDALEVMETRMRHRFGAVFDAGGSEATANAAAGESRSAAQPTVGWSVLSTSTSSQQNQTPQAAANGRVQSTPNLLAVAAGSRSMGPSGASSRAMSRVSSNVQWSSRATAASSAASLSVSSVASNSDPIDLIDLSLGADDDEHTLESFDPLRARSARINDGAPAQDGRLTSPTVAGAGDLLSAFFDTATANIDSGHPVLEKLILPESTLGTVPHSSARPRSNNNNAKEPAGCRSSVSPKGQWVNFE